MKATTWSVKELHILRKHYPDMATLTGKLKKTAYRINKKAGELGLMNQATVSSKPLAVNSKQPKQPKEAAGRLYEPQRRPIAEIEAEIAQVEDLISKGIEAGQAWNRVIDRYNSLCWEYDRALKAGTDTSRKNKLKDLVL
ncbi:hypothetical protein D0T84_16370 [Dysgonomonas sp. 521]|uniref:hypothetical protein n=1 Tax=Dysgonomonas sp. 521 TaxID=2302932 RepID=UPI0013D76BA6|nr:hypothetical protein [Dysgonomonas sp. 521]NDV96477.1 hypothetical protein [Dysgonomonas sp. 521]